MNLRVLALWLHLLAIVVWIGGTFYWALTLYAERRAEHDRDFPARLEAMGRRMYTIGWEALGVIVITGLFNLIDAARTGVLFRSIYLTPFLIKIGLVVGMVGVQLWQHVGLLPRVPKARSSGSDWARWRRRMLIASGVFLMLAGGVMWIGLQLRYV